MTLLQAALSQAAPRVKVLMVGEASEGADGGGSE